MLNNVPKLRLEYWHIVDLQKAISIINVSMKHDFNICLDLKRTNCQLHYHCFQIEICKNLLYNKIYISASIRNIYFLSFHHSVRTEYLYSQRIQYLSDQQPSQSPMNWHRQIHCRYYQTLIGRPLNHDHFAVVSDKKKKEIVLVKQMNIVLVKQINK